MRKWVAGSIFRTTLTAFLVVAIVPIIATSVVFITQTSKELTSRMENELQDLAVSKAEEIDLNLQRVIDTTSIASQMAANTLSSEVSEDSVSQRIRRYQPDNRNVLGLDVYYNQMGGEEALGGNISNVYWDNTRPLTDTVANQIIQTESLDVTFQSIKSVSSHTQWIYLTTKEGMMRLYPWASNDHYPTGWDPREVIFYTVAEPSQNPNLEARWTPPYVDFAGAGWMVTVSMPMMSADSEFLGIMSRDITIGSLKQIALTINVLEDVGYGFLIDKQGAVIAHPTYESADTTKGTQSDVNLLQIGTDGYRQLVQGMVDGRSGLGYYTDESNGEDTLLAYAPIPSIGWSLGITVPRANVVAPAVTMRNQVIGVTAVLIVAVVIVAIFLARSIYRPLGHLLQGVHQIAEDKQAAKMQVGSFEELNSLATAFNEMAEQVWKRETALKATVEELRIEIDATRKQEQVAEITESDYFKDLQRNASRIRNRPYPT